MNIEKKILEEIRTNRNIITECKSKLHILEKNDPKDKTENILITSGMSYLLLFFIIRETSLLNFVPHNLTSLFNLLISGSIGIASQKVIEKTFKNKDKLREFSKAKSNAEIFEEKLKYNIETEKAFINNYHLRNAYYTIKNNNIENEDEFIQEIDGMKNKINEICTKKILVRDSFINKTDTLTHSVVGGLFGMFIYGLPFVIRGVPINMPSIIIPLILGTVLASGYSIRNNRNIKKIINSYNDILNTNDINIKNYKSMQYEINKELENTLDDCYKIRPKNDECLSNSLNTESNTNKEEKYVLVKKIKKPLN